MNKVKFRKNNNGGDKGSKKKSMTPKDLLLQKYSPTGPRGHRVYKTNSGVGYELFKRSICGVSRMLLAMEMKDIGFKQVLIKDTLFWELYENRK